MTIAKGEKAKTWVVSLTNRGRQAAVGIKLEDSHDPDGKNFLLFDDNYFYLLPGEQKCVTVSSLGDVEPEIMLTGFLMS